jgi:hypothetical protein
MTESVPSVQPRMTTAVGTDPHLNRPDVAPADSAEARVGVEPVVESAVTQSSILITEQEVLFGTAAAVRVPGKKTAGRWTALLRPRRLSTRSTTDECAAKDRHYPRHYDFLERALMGREMDRL